MRLDIDPSGSLRYRRIKKLLTSGLVGVSALVLGAGVPGAVGAGAGVGVGLASAQPTTATFLAASNTEPAFDFLTQNFVQTANGEKSVTFSFGGSGGLATKVDGGLDSASNGAGNSPAGFALFASADEANVDNTIADGTAAAANKGAIAQYPFGRCIDSHSVGYTAANGGNNNGTSCPGIASTRAQYTTGRLVIVSCRSGGKTLAPAESAPTCAKPVGGYFTRAGATKAPSTMAEVWSDVLAHTSTAEGTAGANVGGYLAIADPKNGWEFADTGCGPGSVASNAPYGLAGMEALYVAGVGYYAAHPDPALGVSASDEACKEIDQMTDMGSSLDNFGSTSASSGGQSGNGNYSDPTLPIIFGDNVTYTEDSVVAGTSQIALLPKAFVVSPSGDDTDFWAEVPECGVANRADVTVANGWTVDLSNAESCTDRDYVAGMHDNVAADISSGDFGRGGGPKTLLGEHGYYQPIRQWVVVENDDQGRSGAADLATADGRSALAFIHYLLSAKGQAVMASFGYDPIS